MTLWNLFRRSLRVDLRRAVLSGRFVVCVICQIVLLGLIAARHMDGFAGVTYIFEWFPIESLFLAFFVLPAIPYAHSYMSDRNSRFLIQAQARVGKRAYAVSKACAAALSGALSMVASRLVLLFGLSCRLPIYAGTVIDQGGYAQWAQEGHIFLFFLSQFLISAFLGGLVAVFALWVSTWMRNQFVIVTAPLIALYAESVIIDYFLGLRVFRYLNLYLIIFATPGFSSPVICLIYSCAVLALLTGLFMFLFWARVVREV